MNDIFKANVKAKIEKAMEKEGLNQATTAKCIGIAACYVSLIKNPENWDKVPVAAWVIANKWVNSGQGLMEYSKKHGKVLAGTSEPEGPEEHSPESVFEEREPEPIHVRPKLMGMTKPKPAEVNPETNVHVRHVDADHVEWITMKEHLRIVEECTVKIYRLQNELDCLRFKSQEITRDIKLNLIVKVKVEVEP